MKIQQNRRQTVSRTDDMREQGARSVGRSGGSAPFVKWGDDYAWIEGTISDFWEGEYGRVARIDVSNASDNLEAQMDAESAREPVEAGDHVNLGLAYATLDPITDDYLGAKVHVAFVEWGETKRGQNFRNFEILELERAPERRSDRPEPEPQSDEDRPSASVTDDDIPF